MSLKDSELSASQFLVMQGYQPISVHPLGRYKTPDLLIGDEIAVEVRRSPQLIEVEGKIEGIERAAHSFIRSLQNSLDTFAKIPADRSWFILVDFRRPIAENQQKELRKIPRNFLLNGRPPAEAKYAFKGFEIELLEASKYHGRPFLIGMQIDDDSGGFV